MASHPDMSTTSNEHSASNTNAARSRTSSIFRNRFSNASLLSLSRIRTLLPQYSVVDALEEPPASPLSEVNTVTESLWDSPSAIEPPRYSLSQHRQSLMLTRRASTAPGFDVEAEPQTHDFQYSYPIRAKNPWATLQLHARVEVPGTHSKSLQNQPRLPRFWSCDPISGTVQLDLDSPQNIQQISITVWCHFLFLLISCSLLILTTTTPFQAKREYRLLVSYGRLSSISEARIYSLGQVNGRSTPV